MKIIVAVKEFGTNETIKEIECQSMSKAEKVQAGLDKQLNHDLYYSDIEIPTKVEVE